MSNGMKYIVLAVMSTMLLTSARAEMKSSVTQWGITWTFDKEYECGQFVSDDWWVLGPVTITAVSPAPADGLHGTVVDPAAGEQGYDNRSTDFAGGTRAVFPLSVSGTKSIVSTESKAAAERSNMQSAAVLTVVSTDPGADAFRPPFINGDKPFFKTTDIRLDLLPGLGRVPTVTDQIITNYEGLIDGIWLDHVANYNNQMIHPARHMDAYSRDFALDLSNAAVLLMLDNGGKDRKLLYHFIQRGIDYYYQAVQHNALWPANGGHANGRKWPVIFAGIMLGQPDMRTLDFLCNEDAQTYYGNNGKPLWGHACTSADYFLSGCSGGGDKACRDPEGLVDGCSDYRNCCTSHAWMGAGLAAMIMGAEADWDHPAHFDYLDRWITEDVNGATGADADYGGATVQFAWMWYRADAPYVDYNAGIGLTGGGGHTLPRLQAANPVNGARLRMLRAEHARMRLFTAAGIPAGTVPVPGLYFYTLDGDDGFPAGRILVVE